MLPEIGVLSIIMALVFTLIQTGLPLIGYQRQKYEYWVLTVWAAVLQFICLLIALGCLALSFLENDFSVIYIAKQSALALPWFYKIAAIWGGHEGSLLLWIMIVSGWTVMLIIFTERMPLAFKATVLSVLGLMNMGFYVFLLLTSQPFARHFYQVPLDGTDLNPILQDPGLLFHPPMLYMGYVGFAITFAIAIAGLIHNQIDHQWARWCKPWVMLSWSSLTFGIVLGSWWAYHVLGWGGWWFWDPVENASLLPWLLATALIHVLIVTKKQEQLLSWSVVLAILTYILSLLGTFLVRSGVLISVHTFATDPARGIFLLSYLLVVVSVSLVLVAYRIPKLRQTSKVHGLSNTAMLWFNSVLLVTMAATILVGTLYPLVLDVLNLGKISVGLPYFNAVIVPLSVPLLILMGIGIHCEWRPTSWVALIQRLRLPVILTLLASGILWLLLPEPQSPLAYLGIGLGIWVIFSTGLKFISLQSLPALGMGVAHLGVGIMAIAVSVTSNYSQAVEVLIPVGGTVHLNKQPITFTALETVTGPNYKALQGVFTLNSTSLYPQRRWYDVTRQMVSEAGIKVGIFADTYVILGEPINDLWVVRCYYKPMVRWIWAGGILILVGGILACLQLPLQRLRSRYEMV